MQDKKLIKMRQLYKESDELKQQKASYIRKFANQIAQIKKNQKVSQD